MWKLSFAMLVACTGGGQSPLPDGPIENPTDDAGNAICNDDAFEPNNTTAFPTGVGETLDQMSILAELCPAGDVELFSVMVGSMFEATLTAQDGALLDLAVITEGGTTIAEGEPTGTAGEVRIAMPSSPALGHVLVRAGGTGRHAYRLQLRATR